MCVRYLEERKARWLRVRKLMELLEASDSVDARIRSWNVPEDVLQEWERMYPTIRLRAREKMEELR